MTTTREEIDAQIERLQAAVCAHYTSLSEAYRAKDKSAAEYHAEEQDRLRRRIEWQRSLLAALS